MARCSDVLYEIQLTYNPEDGLYLLRLIPLDEEEWTEEIALTLGDLTNLKNAILAATNN